MPLALGKGWDISDVEAREIGYNSFVLAPLTISDSKISLGGEGGKAPGSGGGGGGAMGYGAVAGDGGSGGAVVSATFLASDLPDAIEVVVGKGGSGGKNGGDGDQGEDSSFGEFLRAAGGEGGHGGHTKASAMAADAPSDDLSVFVSSAFLVNYAEVHEGLLHTVGAVWSHYTVSNVPAFMAGQVVVVAECDGGQSVREFTLDFELLRPDGSVAWTFPVPVYLSWPAPIVRVVCAPGFGLEVNSLGIWHATVSRNSTELARVSFDVSGASA